MRKKRPLTKSDQFSSKSLYIYIEREREREKGRERERGIYNVDCNI